MRPAVIALIILASAALTGAFPPEKGKRPAAPSGSPPASISQAEAYSYGFTIHQAALRISENYVKPVSEEKLVAAALQALHQAVGAPLPEHLRTGDLEKALTGRDLSGELQAARMALGNQPSIKGEAAVRLGLQAMMKLLDPHSAYIGPDEGARSNSQPGELSGIGLTLEEGIEPGSLVVRTVTLNGPAQAEGILPNDGILEINGLSAAKLSTAEASRLVSVGPGGEVNLTLLRAGTKEPRKVRLVGQQAREPLVMGAARRDDGSWDFLLDRQNKIGLIRVGPLNWTRDEFGASELPDSKDEVRRAIEQLKEAGLRGLILDLRECPGGTLMGAVRVADLFLDEGLVATIESRKEFDSRTYRSEKEGSFLDFPMVALVGPDTSGGGELIGAALQDHGRARIAGQRTRGKGSVQSPQESVGQNHSIRLTTGFFVRPNGKPLQRFADSKAADPWGVQPEADLEVRVSPTLRRQVRAWRLQQDLRPARSRAVLPLDDPEKDPTLFVALQDLLQRQRAARQ